MTWLTIMAYICVINDHEYVLLVVNTSRSFPHSWLTTEFLTRLTRRVPLVEQELLTLPEHQSSPPFFSGVCANRSWVFCVCFVDRCLFYRPFYVGSCVVCPSSICGFWLPLWYLQTLHYSIVYQKMIYLFKYEWPIDSKYLL